jgi:hypothetical protein
VKVALTPLPPIEEALVNCDQGFFFSFDQGSTLCMRRSSRGELLERY